MADTKSLEEMLSGADKDRANLAAIVKTLTGDINHLREELDIVQKKQQALEEENQQLRQRNDELTSAGNSSDQLHQLLLRRQQQHQNDFSELFSAARTAKEEVNKIRAELKAKYGLTSNGQPQAPEPPNPAPDNSKPPAP